MQKKRKYIEYTIKYRVLPEDTVSIQELLEEARGSGGAVITDVNIVPLTEIEFGKWNTSYIRFIDEEEDLP